VAAVLFLSNIFIFIPIFIFQGNITGFNFYLPMKMLFLLVPFLAGVLVLTVVGILLPEKAHRIFIVIITALGILFWIQGTFLVWNVGVLDGSIIQWNIGKWRGFVDGAIWLIMLGVAVILSHRLYRLTVYAGLAIIFYQVVMVCILTVRKPEIWYRHVASSQAPPEKIFEFSTRQNVLHILLDQFGSGLFDDVLRENNSIAGRLDGFTWFRSMTTSSHVTTISVPSYLSGNIYSNNMPVMDFFRENYDTNNIYDALYRKGFDLDIVNQPAFLKHRNIFTNYYNIPTPYNTQSRFQTYLYNSSFLFDLSLFRCTPFFLKNLVYNDQSWLFSSLTLPAKFRKYEHYSANEFLLEMSAQASVKRNKPVYKYLHLMTPHPPLVVGSDQQFAGEVLPETEDINFKYQAVYTLNNLLGLLDRMKSIGLYDSTLIIIHSDHGSGIRFTMQYPDGRSGNNHGVLPSDAFLPVFLIKLPGEHGPLKTSTAQGQLTDLPATLCKYLKIEAHFPGISLYDLDTVVNRARYCYYSSVTDRNDAMISGYFDDYQEYIVTGDPFMAGSWTKGEIMEKKLKAYTWGTVLQMNSKSDINSYLLSGWSFPEDDHTWSNGKKAILQMSVNPPKGDQIELFCEVSPFLSPEKGLGSQRVEITINGSPVGNFTISSSGQQQLRVTFKKELLANFSQVLVGFSLPDAAVGKEMGVNGDGRMLGLAFYSLVLKEL